MATKATELERMWREIESLKKKMAQLERPKNGKRRAPARTRQTVMSERERARAILREAGLLAELTPQEKELAAEWRALPEDEKQRVNQELWNLKLEKPLSQIIIENR